MKKPTVSEDGAVTHLTVNNSTVKTLWNLHKWTLPMKFSWVHFKVTFLTFMREEKENKMPKQIHEVYEVMVREDQLQHLKMVFKNYQTFFS